MSDATDDLDYEESGLGAKFRKIDKDLWDKQMAERLLKSDELQANTKPSESKPSNLTTGGTK